ncbi:MULTISPECIES: DUF3908 family protein [Paenibacillus]|uniref:Uncharacterized protein DUF3908 n=1 Tax=Paenibacillus pabuli TaxID=1472 RepID=A0ABX9BC84_9BACL|nr:MULTISPECIES: DUF3908 family protein [Paenibacillus]RAI85656.1 uncharacterized protein DUF3908 [Paenibacillus pabuli]SEL29321.1 Protein of unknown function [Paenibacillus sp. OK003]
MNSYHDFKREMGSISYGGYTKILSNIQKYVTDDEVRAFYPKNFFTDSAEVEFFIFTEKSIIRFRQNARASDVMYYKNFQVETLRIIKSNSRQEERQLEIKLRSGESFFFDSKADSNHHWEDTYGKYIENIFIVLK